MLYGCCTEDNSTVLKNTVFESLITDTSGDAVALATVRQHLRLPNDSDTNDLLAIYTNTARLSIEKETGFSLLNETWELAIDEQPSSNQILLRQSPLVSVTHIKSYDSSDTESTFSSSKYTVDTVAGRVFLNDAESWPDSLRQHRSLVITYVAGHSAESDIPFPIRQALLLYTGELWENREDAGIPPQVRALINQYKTNWM